MISFDSIVDKVYEAAVVPELWPKVLDDIATISGTAGGVLFASKPTISVVGGTALAPAHAWTASRSLESVFTAFLEGGWMERNLRGQRAFEINHIGFVNDQDLCTAEEIETHPFYRFVREWGLGWATGVSIRVPTGDALLFNWERRFVDGPIDRETVALLDPLRGHLARSALVASRLGLERARATAEMLESLGLPSAVLCARGRIVSANGLLQQLIPGVLQDRSMERVRLSDRNADALFEAVLAEAHKIGDRGGPSGRKEVLSIPIPAQNDHPPIVLHVIPVRRAACDIFAAAANIVILTPINRAEVPDARVIQGLFDLTAAEARIAHQISGGATVRDISETSGISQGTIRNQLKAVFAKTGVSKQSDLVGLLGRVNPWRMSAAKDPK